MDRRSMEYLVISGLVLPLLTVGAVRWASLTWNLSVLVVLLVLFALPFLAAVGLVGTGPWEAGMFGQAPNRGPEKFRDQIPDRFHEEFAVETLNENVAENPGASPLRRYALLYCGMVPAITLLVMII